MLSDLRDSCSRCELASCMLRCSANHPRTWAASSRTASEQKSNGLGCIGKKINRLTHNSPDEHGDLFPHGNTVKVSTTLPARVHLESDVKLARPLRRHGIRLGLETRNDHL